MKLSVSIYLQLIYDIKVRVSDSTPFLATNMHGVKAVRNTAYPIFNKTIRPLDPPGMKEAK